MKFNLMPYLQLLPNPNWYAWEISSTLLTTLNMLLLPFFLLRIHTIIAFVWELMHHPQFYYKVIYLVLCYISSFSCPSAQTISFSYIIIKTSMIITLVSSLSFDLPSIRLGQRVGHVGMKNYFLSVPTLYTID